MERHEKRITLTKHGRKRMKQRGVSREQVEQAVYDPDKVAPARNQGATSFVRRISATRKLKVIADEMDDRIHIITVYWIAQPKRKAKRK